MLQHPLPPTPVLGASHQLGALFDLVRRVLSFRCSLLHSKVLLKTRHWNGPRCYRLKANLGDKTFKGPFSWKHKRSCSSDDYVEEDDFQDLTFLSYSSIARTWRISFLDSDDLHCEKLSWATNLLFQFPFSAPVS